MDYLPALRIARSYQLGIRTKSLSLLDLLCPALISSYSLLIIWKENSHSVPSTRLPTLNITPHTSSIIIHTLNCQASSTEFRRQRVKERRAHQNPHIPRLRRASCKDYRVRRAGLTSKLVVRDGLMSERSEESLEGCEDAGDGLNGPVEHREEVEEHGEEGVEGRLAREEVGGGEGCREGEGEDGEEG